jgi:hypothetical protein
MYTYIYIYIYHNKRYFMKTHLYIYYIYIHTYFEMLEICYCMRKVLLSNEIGAKLKQKHDLVMMMMMFT